MMNFKFIKVGYYDRYAFQDECTNHERLKKCFKSANIRLDAFLEIDDLETKDVEESGRNISKINVSRCYLTRTQGLGLNGIASDIYLTEESYYRLKEKLFLE